METVLGAETEYAISAFGGDINVRVEDITRRLFRLAARTMPHLPTHDGSRLFLLNGGCFYVDIGDHIEYATPECSDPWDLVRYVRAGDEILCKLASRLSDQSGIKVRVGRGNVGYGEQPQTWACHESYLCRLPPKSLVDGLVPFLCSRVVYCGGGGFDPYSPGVSFSLAPRTAFVGSVSSGDSTRSRSIVHLKDEPLNDQGYHRLHLICGDALGSELAMWLRAGTTALVVALLDQKYSLPRELTPANPLRAMRVFASDPTLTASVVTVTERRVTALEIQWAYLRAVESSNRKRLPGWASTVLKGWRRTLELLQNGPGPMETALDWPIKARVYGDYCAEQGMDWHRIPDYNRYIEKIAVRYRRSNTAFPGCLSRTVVTGSQSPVHNSRLLTSYIERHNLDWDELAAVQALRPKLFELEMRYLQVQDGIFAQLESAGVLDHVAIPDRTALGEAVVRPPQGTRAHVRGECVSRYSGTKSITCSWSRVNDAANKRAICLDDPLTTRAEWSAYDTAADDDDEELTAEGVFAAIRQTLGAARASRTQSR